MSQGQVQWCAWWSCRRRLAHAHRTSIQRACWRLWVEMIWKNLRRFEKIRGLPRSIFRTSIYYCNTKIDWVTCWESCCPQSSPAYFCDPNPAPGLLPQIHKTLHVLGSDLQLHLFDATDLSLLFCGWRFIVVILLFVGSAPIHRSSLKSLKTPPLWNHIPW